MKTVLVIEDDAAIRENACEMLELKGYKAIAAANGKIGIALALENIPDLILCDIVMPEANGYDVFNALKINALTKQIPFVFLTASVAKKEIEAGFGMGAKGYISKPFDAEDFFDTINKCLQVIT